MAKQSGNSARPRKKRLKYFFLNGQLHKVLHISRPHDLVVCWVYPEHKRMSYSWSYIRTHYERAWTTVEVAEMLGKTRRTISNYLMKFDIPKPGVAYGLSDVEREHQYFWSEEHILALHEYILTVHIGRPRKDGFVRAVRAMPNRTELLAMLRHDTVMYVKTADGEFSPAWKEPEWQ